MFYSHSRLFTHNRIVNIVVGDRGVGKTYDLTKLCIDLGLSQQDDSFAWVRRYKEDLKPLKDAWWKDVEANESKYKGIEFSSSGFALYAKRRLGEKFKIGNLVSLGDYQRWKSVPHPKLKLMVFDEFQAEGDSRYLPNELNMWLSLIDSFMRNRDVKIVMLSNANTMSNPYFEQWLKLSRNDLSESEFIKGPWWCIESTNYDYAEYRKAHRESKFGEIVKGTAYSDYSIDNKFMLDDLTDVEAEQPKGGREELWNLAIEGQLLRVSEINGFLRFDRTKDRTFQTYAFYPKDAKDSGCPLLPKSSYPIRKITDAYLGGSCSFQDVRAKNAVMSMVRSIYKGF